MTQCFKPEIIDSGVHRNSMPSNVAKKRGFLIIYVPAFVSGKRKCYRENLGNVRKLFEDKTHEKLDFYMREKKNRKC